MTVRFSTPVVPKTEGGLTRALMKHFDWQKRRCYPNVHLFPWESDLLVVSASGYATEVEIKVSAADWRHDAEKDKWQPHLYSHYTPGNVKPERRDWNQDRGWQFVKTFWYAVPPQLIARIPESVPEWAGILTVDEQGRVRTHRPATMRKKVQPLDEKHLNSLASSVYWRFTQHFMKK